MHTKHASQQKEKKKILFKPVSFFGSQVFVQFLKAFKLGF